MRALTIHSTFGNLSTSLGDFVFARSTVLSTGTLAGSCSGCRELEGVTVPDLACDDPGVAGGVKAGDTVVPGTSGVEEPPFKSESSQLRRNCADGRD